jgi:putative PIN family toxin of toxin-antitoxin system
MPEGKNKLRLVIDTNVWVSFAIGRHMDSVSFVVLHPTTEVFASKELLDELTETLKKPKLQKIISSSRRQAALKLIKQSVFVVNPKTQIKFPRDPKDAFLLSLSKECKADFLITGDKDLLSLETFELTEIISLVNFLKKLK